MTTCADIRDAFVRGARLPSDLVQTHLSECSACRELFESDADLGRSLARQVTGAMPFPEHLFDQLEQRLACETGLRAWLRARPTELRVLLVVLSVLLVVLVGGAFKLRSDFADYPAGRVFWLLGAYLIGILLAFRQELSLPRPGRWLSTAPQFALSALVLPFLIAWLPASEVAGHAGPGGALNCFSYGALLTLPTALLLWAFDRDDCPSLRTVCLSAVALGLSGNFLLELHCPNGNVRHLILGHASIGVAWLMAWFVLRRSLRAPTRTN
jgi:hypothetical protein